MQRNLRLPDNKIEIQQVEIKMLQKLLTERDANIEELNKSIELQNNYVARLEADYKELFKELHILSKKSEQEKKKGYGVGTSTMDMDDPLFRVAGISETLPSGASASSPNSDVEKSYHIIQKYD